MAVATPATPSPCQYQHWWRERALRSTTQRGRSPPLTLSEHPPAVFDPDRFRLVEPKRRVIDLEKGHQHNLSESSVFTSTTLVSNTALLEKEARPASSELPPYRYSNFIRRLRYSIFAVYQRLFTFIFLVNLIIVLIVLHNHSWNTSTTFTLTHLATLTSSNFLLAILFRQDWLVNLLFRTAWLVPWSLPLRVRRIVSRVYCYGGIHSGAAVMGTLWWVGFSVMLSWEGVEKGLYTPALLILTLVIAALLLVIVILSLPQLRVRYHDTWELTHRFLGWTSILLFWAQILLLTHYTITTSPLIPDQSSFTRALIRTPTFWCLTVITLLLIYPWLLLRRWTFTATPLSPHALQLSFPNPVHKYSCLVLSSSPLREWHPFATFPSSLDPSSSSSSTSSTTTTNSLVISAAGDWTRSLIATAHWKRKEAQLLPPPAPPSTNPLTPTSAPDQPQPPVQLQMQFWVKSHPHPGVLSLSCLYTRIVILTTGSGIGPSLSSLLDRPPAQIARLVWSTRSPVRTYGKHILELVGKADPNAVVLDTDQSGRPDLVMEAWKAVREVSAEAVFVLSNERVTRQVVGALEGRGIPAFGPIWDS